MYCVISWDISAVNPRWREIDDQLRACIQNFTYVRPVNTFYLVRISSADRIEAIRKCFDAVKQNTKESISYILSPAFAGHTWSGTIGDWPNVNAITQPSP